MLSTVPSSLTRARIIQTARTMIETNGLAALSLRRVAAELDVTAPALYAYVTDKRDLQRGVAEHELESLMRRFDEIHEADPIEHLRCQCRVYVDYAVENPELFRTMFLFPPELSIMETTGDELPAATKAFQAALGIAATAVDRGLLGNSQPLDAALTLWAATHGVAEVLLLGIGFDTAQRTQLLDGVVDTVIAGLQTR
jgi:AcrR family transcriptional regulator